MASLILNTQIDTFLKFATTAPKISWFIDEITSRTVSFRFTMLSGLALKTFSFTYPQRKKSKGDRSGVQQIQSNKARRSFRQTFILA